MRSIHLASSVCLAVLALVSCSRDPNVLKRRYVESGNKFYDNGKYAEARLYYKRALQRDLRYGPAYYRLGLTEMKLKQYNAAVAALVRSLELDEQDKPDAEIKLSEMYLTFGNGDKKYLDDVETYCKDLLKRDANSYDGHRLMGDLSLMRAGVAFKGNFKEDAQNLLEQSVAEYRKADSVKPGQPPVMLQLARALAGKADYAGAEQLYKQILDRDKAFEPAYVDLYKLYMYQNKPEQGEQLLKSAAQNNPKVVGYLTMLAMHYSSVKRPTEMAGMLEQIKTHYKDFPDAFLLVGDFYLRLGDGDTARKEYREGIVRDPKRKPTYQQRIVEVLMQQGKKSEASDVNSQILQADPNNNFARGIAASLLLDKGNINKAVSELNAVVAHSPDNAIAQYNLARAHVARGEWDAARQGFQKAISVQPNYVAARLSLAQLQLGLGQFEAAFGTADAVLGFDRTNGLAHLIKSASLIGQKKFPEATEMLQTLLKTNPSSPDIYLQLGALSMAQHKFKESEEYFRKCYQLNPASSRGLIGLVKAYAAEGRSEEALQLLQTEVDKTPTRLDLRAELADAAAQVGKFDVAITEYTKVLNALDKDAKQRGAVYMRIGEVYRRKGDDGNAIANMMKARQIMPDDGNILLTLALAYDHAGRTTESKEVYEAAVKIDPDNPTILNNLAFLLAEHGGDLNEALSKATRAKQLMPNRPEVADTLGLIYLKKNLSDPAIDIFREIVTKVPTQATYRYHLGMALKLKGDKVQAIKELSQALKNNPTKYERDEIQKLLTTLNAS